MRLFSVLASALAIAATASAVRAGDTTRWGGFYFGTGVGASGNSVNFDVENGVGPIEFAKLGMPGGTAEIFGGFNVPVGNTGFIGVETGVSFPGGEAREASNVSSVLDTDTIYTLSGRAGLLVGPDTMLYGKGGWALIHSTAPAARWDDAADSTWLDGVTFGVGLDTKVTDRFSVRTEIGYTTALGPLPIALQGGFDELSPSFLTATIGATLQVGGSETGRTAETDFRAYDWTGFYVGGYGGGTAGGSLLGHYDTPDQGPYSEIAPGAGVWVGYDVQVMDRWVVGVEGDGTWLGQTSTASGDDMPFARYEWMAGVGGKAGYLVRPSTLVYTKAGWAMVSTEATPTYFLGDADTALIHSLQLAFGMETKVNRNMSVRVEGTFTSALDRFWLNRGAVPQTDFLMPNFVGGRAGVAAHF